MSGMCRLSVIHSQSVGRSEAKPEHTFPALCSIVRNIWKALRNVFDSVHLVFNSWFVLIKYSWQIKLAELDLNVLNICQ